MQRNLKESENATGSQSLSALQEDITHQPSFSESAEGADAVASSQESVDKSPSAAESPAQNIEMVNEILRTLDLAEDMDAEMIKEIKKTLDLAEDMEERVLKNAIYTYTKCDYAEMASIVLCDEIDRKEIKRSVTNLMKEYNCSLRALGRYLLDLSPTETSQFLEAQNDWKDTSTISRLLWALLKMFVEHPRRGEDLNLWQSCQLSNDWYIRELAYQLTERLLTSAIFTKCDPEEIVRIVLHEEIDREKIKTSVSNLLEEYNCSQRALGRNLLDLSPTATSEFLEAQNDWKDTSTKSQLFWALLKVFADHPRRGEDLNLWQNCQEITDRNIRELACQLTDHLKSTSFYSNSLVEEMIRIESEDELNVENIRARISELRRSERVTYSDLSTKLLKSSESTFKNLMAYQNNQWRTMTTRSRLLFACTLKWLDFPDHVDQIKSWNIAKRVSQSSVSSEPSTSAKKLKKIHPKDMSESVRESIRDQSQLQTRITPGFTQSSSLPCREGRRQCLSLDSTELERLAEEQSFLVLEHFKNTDFYTEARRQRMISIALQEKLDLEQIRKELGPLRKEHDITYEKLGIHLLGSGFAKDKFSPKKLLSAKNDRWKTMQMKGRLRFALIRIWLDDPNRLELMKSWIIAYNSNKDGAVAAKRPKTHFQQKRR